MKTPLLALLTAVTIFNTVGCGKGTPPAYHLHGWFRTLQTLKAGDPVMMASVQIGYVGSIALDPSRAEIRVTMHIQRSVVVKTDSTATIISKAWTDRSCIVLDGGSPGAPVAVENTFLMTREAVKWYRKGAEQGDAKAQYNLGICYREGQGVAQDEVQAFKWMLPSGAQGHEVTNQYLTRLESQLTREQIEEGKQRADAWLQQHKKSATHNR